VLGFEANPLNVSISPNTKSIFMLSGKGSSVLGVSEETAHGFKDCTGILEYRIVFWIWQPGDL
jgi:hypothetical protein